METVHPGRRRTLPPVPRAAARTAWREAQVDAGQRFVARLRAAAAEFAAAAGAETAVVREVVPPARHRRSRCRVVLRDRDGCERDLTFLGAAGSPVPERSGFEADIVGWLAAAPSPPDGWLVGDPDACGGTAIDLSAWRAAG